ncbi:hypothetical protein GM655_04995 [Pseudoduganella danionis]|uniref:DUF4398 domain-containing protein n=2 Tax=Pseudoduganella danionis TaxID=1890295 RepID=A0ABW9SJ74_9BURK|nr:hypothetical protein [Pseudoduganella danionis]
MVMASKWKAQLVALLGLGLLLALPAQADYGAARWPKVQSVEQANVTLRQVEQERALVQDQFAEAERVCYGRFFVNACLSDAKEVRRKALAVLRAAEVDAEHFKRADSVEKRDAELAERARKDAEEEAQHAAQPPKAPKVVDDTPRPPPVAGPVVDREARHAEKLKKLEAQDAANAGKRAENVVNFERKQQESQRRQAEVARKKAENEAKQAAKAEAEQRKAEAAKRQ